MSTKLSYKLRALTAALFTPGLALAAPPVAYDGWAASNGTIDTSASCGQGSVTCRTLAEDNGFLQQEVDTGTSKYIRIVMSDADATGNASQLNFASESYIPFAVSDPTIQQQEQGLASRQVIRDTANGFESVSEVQKGDFKHIGTTVASEMYNVKLSQHVFDADMDSTFSFTNYTQGALSPAENSPDTSLVVGFRTDISQTVFTGTPGDTTQRSVFDFRQRSGRQDRGLFWPPSSDLVTAGSETLNGTQVSWANRDNITSTWIAQSDNVNPGMVALTYQSVENVTTGAQASQYGLDIPEPANPFSWNAANFGTAPSLP